MLSIIMKIIEYQLDKAKHLKQKLERFLDWIRYDWTRPSTELKDKADQAKQDILGKDLD